MEELKKEMSDINGGMQNIDAELKEYNEVLEKAANVYDMYEDIEQILMQNDYTNSDMRRIIEKIIVYPDKSVKVFMK